MGAGPDTYSHEEARLDSFRHEEADPDNTSHGEDGPDNKEPVRSHVELVRTPKATRKPA